MNTKHMMATFACAAAFCGSVQAAEAEAEKNSVDSKEESSQGWNWAMGEGVTFNEQPIVSAEVGLAIDSKYLSYGLVDNNEPIITPSASLTLFDWLTFSVESIFDMTKYGRRENDAGEEAYVNRAGRYQELDPGVSLGHTFSKDDYEWLPTSVEFSFGYMYEYHPRSFNTRDDDTQFATFDISLPDLEDLVFVTPTFSYERDIDRDNGTYLNLELAHTFALIDGEEEGDDPVLGLCISLAQGWGDRRRVAGYLTDFHDVSVNEDGEEEYGTLDRQGFMDTCLTASLEWAVTDGVTVGAYVAYSDYLLDRKMRDAACGYEATGKWDHAYNFVGGVSVAVAF